MIPVILALAVLSSASEQQIVIVGQCDLVELNHYYDGQGEKIFDQLIFWDWSDRWGFHVRDWRFIHPGVIVDRHRRGVAVLFRDTKHGNLYDVRATSYRETWTQHDPEVADKKNWPDSARKRMMWRW